MNTKPVRRDVEILCATTELFFGVRFPDSDHEFVGELLDQFSTRGILAGIEILSASEPGRDLLPLIRRKLAVVLGYIAEGGPLDETTADAWRVYDSSGHLPDALALEKFRDINLGKFAAFASGAVN